MSHGDDVSRSGFDHRYRCCLTTLVRRRYVFVHCICCGGLYLRIDGGANRVTTATEERFSFLRGFSELLAGENRLQDVVAEEGRVRGGAPVGCPRWIEHLLHGYGRGALGLFAGDVTQFGHSIDNHIAALGCVVRIAQRIVGGRSLDDGCQCGSFSEIQIGSRFREVAPGGSFDAVGTGSEVGDVHVARENLAFAEPLLKGQCQPRFSDLPGETVATRCFQFLAARRLVYEDVLDVLHRQSR